MHSVYAKHKKQIYYSIVIHGPGSDTKIRTPSIPRTRP